MNSMVEFHVPVQGDIDATKMMKCWCFAVPLLVLVIATVTAEREMSLKAYLEAQERKVLQVEDKIRQRNDGTLETKPEKHQLRKESSEKTRQVKQEANGNDAPYCDNTSRYQTLDGTCNNLYNPVLGSANTAFIRLPGATSDYADGLSTPRQAKDGNELPNARRLSFRLFTNKEQPSAIMSHMAMTWGELLWFILFFVYYFH